MRRLVKGQEVPVQPASVHWWLGLPVKKIDGLEKTDGLDLWGKAHDRFETGLSKRFRLLSPHGS